MVKLLVVFGGNTPEHEVSLASANGVLTHAAGLGWEVLPVGVTRDARWLVGPGALEWLWRQADPALLPRGNAPSEPVPGAGGEVEAFAGPPPAAVFAGYRLAFPVCHGRWGEDGTLQGLLRCYGLRIVGCGVAASAVCFDKHLTRMVLRAAALPIAKGVRISRHDYARDLSAVVEVVDGEVGAGPWFVKPARGGSSLGIGRATSPAELHAAIDEALRWDAAALVEEAVPHRELVLGVLEHAKELVVSPLGECIPVGALYTYEEKYRLGNPRFTCPADLDPGLTEAAQRLAGAAFRALGCSIFARVDLFVDTRTGGLLVNEINTIPGLTATSVFPKVMQAAGYSYPALLAELCRLTEQHDPRS